LRKLDKTREAHADNEEWKKKMKEEREKGSSLSLCLPVSLLNTSILQSRELKESPLLSVRSNMG